MSWRENDKDQLHKWQSSSEKRLPLMFFHK